MDRMMGCFGMLKHMVQLKWDIFRFCILEDSEISGNSNPFVYEQDSEISGTKPLCLWPGFLNKWK